MEGLKKVQVFGKDQEIFFGMSAIEWLSAKGETTKELLQSLSIPTVANILYAGIMGAAHMRGEAFDLRFAEVYNEAKQIVLTKDEKTLQSLIQAYTISLDTKEPDGKVKSEKMDWQKVRAFAFGELGLSFQGYASLTLNH
jgi:hypothetical protein